MHLLQVRSLYSVLYGSVPFPIALLTCSSVLIQAADTYIHITTEAVNLVQAWPLQATDYQQSRGLAPWCLNRRTGDGLGNKHFWGCGLLKTADGLVFANKSRVQSGLGKNMILDFDDTNDHTQYAIVGPSTDTLAEQVDVDFAASSFAVSTQCSPVPAAACTVSETISANAQDVTFSPFNCSSEAGGINLSGNLTNFANRYSFLDAHKYISDSTPFQDGGFSNKTADFIVKATSATEEEGNTTFRNPWHWVASVNLGSVDIDGGVYRIPWHADPHILREISDNPSRYLLLNCTTSGKFLSSLVRTTQVLCLLTAGSMGRILHYGKPQGYIHHTS